MFTVYDSPLGRLWLESNGETLTGLWFDGQKYAPEVSSYTPGEALTPVLEETVRWLDEYFAGKKPTSAPALSPEGTEFQKQVWELLLEIPYGETTTYGELARKIAEKRDVTKMSAQAVGNAVGRNPISLIIPCHRVIGSDGSLTGYAAGVDKKARLLQLEKTGNCK